MMRFDLGFAHHCLTCNDWLLPNSEHEDHKLSHFRQTETDTHSMTSFWDNPGSQQQKG